MILFAVFLLCFKSTAHRALNCGNRLKEQQIRYTAKSNESTADTTNLLENAAMVDGEEFCIIEGKQSHSTHSTGALEARSVECNEELDAEVSWATLRIWGGSIAVHFLGFIFLNALFTMNWHYGFLGGGPTGILFLISTILWSSSIVVFQPLLLLTITPRYRRPLAVAVRSIRSTNRY